MDDTAQNQPQNTQTISVDGVAYPIADLSPTAIQIVKNLQVIEGKIQQVKQDELIFQTAKNTFVQALKANLPEQKDTAEIAPANTSGPANTSSDVSFLVSD